MTARSSEVTIPNVRLGLEELLGVIQSLDEPSRARVAQAIADVEMDTRFKDLIEQLAAKAPAHDITDAEIEAEVRAVRSAAHSARRAGSSSTPIFESAPSSVVP
jgi:membrane-bound lytic murein transglycosylase B